MLPEVPEPERALRPGQTEHANDRGSRIHDNCELYVRGDHDALAPEALNDSFLNLADSPSLLLGDVGTTPPISTPGPEIPDPVEADEPVVVPT